MYIRIFPRADSLRLAEWYDKITILFTMVQTTHENVETLSFIYTRNCPLINCRSHPWDLRHIKHPGAFEVAESDTPIHIRTVVPKARLI